MNGTDDEGRPFVRQPRTIVAALVIAAILAVAAWLVLSPSGHGQQATPAPTRTASSKPSSAGTAPPATPAYGSACGLHGGNPGPATKPPTDLKWQSVRGWLLPRSKSQGPGRVSPTGEWSCYAHTPTGAVLAAYIIQARLGLAADWTAVLNNQTVPGPGVGALAAQGRPHSNSAPPTPIGYVMNAYSPSVASVSLYIMAQKYGPMTCTTTVQWYAGDWRLQLLPDGSTSTGCAQSAPPTYVSWGAR